MKSKFLFVYTTFPNEEKASEVAKHVVKKRLAACANILPQMKSVYWWKDALQEEPEVIVIFKTTDKVFPLLKNEIAAIHSYETPCIVALHVMDGHDPFLRWIDDQTKKFEI